jgi:hypothetical protein
MFANVLGKPQHIAAQQRRVKAMKKMKALLLVAALFVSACSIAQVQPIPCGPHGGPCVFIQAPAGGAPGVQIENRRGIGIGQLIYSDIGVGLWSGALQEGGTGVWAVGGNGGTALRVQGPMLKPRTTGNVLELYDVNTGALLYTFEFAIKQQ